MLTKKSHLKRTEDNLMSKIQQSLIYSIFFWQLYFNCNIYLYGHAFVLFLLILHINTKQRVPVLYPLNPQFHRSHWQLLYEFLSVSEHLYYQRKTTAQNLNLLHCGCNFHSVGVILFSALLLKWLYLHRGTLHVNVDEEALRSLSLLEFHQTILSQLQECILCGQNINFVF